MIVQSGQGIPPAPRFNAEPPRSFAQGVRAKEGDPNVFNFNQPGRNDGSSVEFQTDVPRSVTRHSPDGFSWGYAGSGAQELALNILNYVFPPGSDGYEPVLAGENYVSHTAERLYGLYTREIIANIPRDQPFQIRREEVEQWAKEKGDELKGEIRLPNFFSGPSVTPVERIAHLTSPPQVSTQPTTRTDQTSDTHHWQAWDRAHSELGALNVQIKKEISQYVLDLKRQSAAIDGDKESQQRHFYSNLIDLGRLVHAIDVELFRAEEHRVPHNLRHILQRLPTKLEPLFEKFIGLIDQESVEVRNWFDSIGVQRVAAEIMNDQVVTGISAIPYGPSLMIACSNRNAWRSVNNRIRGSGSDECGGFATSVSIAGMPILIIAVPTFDMNIFTTEGQAWKRSILIHEREHIAQRLRECGTNDDSFAESTHPKEAVKKAFFASYTSHLRDEFLAYGLSADWNSNSRNALLARQGGRNGALYDFPSIYRESWATSLKTMLPHMSEQEHQELLGSVKWKYYAWLRELMDKSTVLSSSIHQGVHHGIRALDFLSPDTWPRHMARMIKLGLLSDQR